MDRTILVTGATGFVGSAVALALLDRGCSIVSLERPAEPGGPVGGRTLAKLEEAARGFGVELGDEQRARVTALPYDLDALREDDAHRQALSATDAVWHCAAAMTFSPKRINESFAFNVGKTVELYRLFAEVSSAPRRFFYVSTAYTAGLEPGPIPEAVHPAPVPCNTYFTTKWAAEMALRAIVADGGAVPVTVYRTSSVVGHSETGRYWGNTFALYSLIEILAFSAHMKNLELRMSFDPEVSHPYVPIDDVAQNAATLICDVEKDEPFSVVHDVGTDWTDGALAEAMDDLFGVHTSWEDPVSEVDKMVHSKIEKYRPMHGPDTPRPFQFAEGRLKSLLGDGYRRHELDRDMLRKLAMSHAKTLAARAAGG